MNIVIGNGGTWFVITKTADTASRGMFAYMTTPFWAGPGDEAKQHE